MTTIVVVRLLQKMFQFIFLFCNSWWWGNYSLCPMYFCSFWGFVLYCVIFLFWNSFCPFWEFILLIKFCSNFSLLSFSWDCYWLKWDICVCRSWRIDDNKVCILITSSPSRKVCAKPILVDLLRTRFIWKVVIDIRLAAVTITCDELTLSFSIFFYKSRKWWLLMFSLFVNLGIFISKSD